MSYEEVDRKFVEDLCDDLSIEEMKTLRDLIDELIVEREDDER